MGEKHTIHHSHNGKGKKPKHLPYPATSTYRGNQQSGGWSLSRAARTGLEMIANNAHHIAPIVAGIGVGGSSSSGKKFTDKTGKELSYNAGGDNAGSTSFVKHKKRRHLNKKKVRFAKKIKKIINKGFSPQLTTIWADPSGFGANTSVIAAGKKQFWYCYSLLDYTSLHKLWLQLYPSIDAQGVSIPTVGTNVTQLGDKSKMYVKNLNSSWTFALNGALITTGAAMKVQIYHWVCKKKSTRVLGTVITGTGAEENIQGEDFHAFGGTEWAHTAGAHETLPQISPFDHHDLMKYITITKVETHFLKQYDQFNMTTSFYPKVAWEQYKYNDQGINPQIFPNLTHGIIICVQDTMWGSGDGTKGAITWNNSARIKGYIDKNTGTKLYQPYQ